MSNLLIRGAEALWTGLPGQSMRSVAGADVRVRGGLNPEIPCLDGLGLADNTIEVTPCPDCE